MNEDQHKLTVQPTIPTGTLRELGLSKIQPSTDNPRLLFDPKPFAALKASIREHGVLVPLTVHLPPGSTVYNILDGERRYRCCVELAEEGIRLTVKANIVDTPTRLAGLLAMFSIHNFREGWELMPTALSLKDVMEELNELEADNERLKELTGLSIPQIERCRTLLSTPEQFQLLSLDPNPATRIPPNFWIEATRVVSLIEERLPDETKALGGRDGILWRLTEKYRKRAIKSVIHFRRVMEAFTLPSESDPDYEDNIRKATVRLSEWLTNIDYETRAAFDPLVTDEKTIKKAVSICGDFTKDLRRLKLDYALERDELRDSLMSVQEFISDLLEKLKGEDAPASLFGTDQDDNA